jgi:hypothetical protein
MSKKSTLPQRNRLHAVAVATLLAFGMPMAGAAVQVTGDYFTNPGGLPIDDVNNNLGTAQAYIRGSLLVDNGSKLTLGTVSFDFGSGPFAQSFIDGAGTRVDLIGPGNRLEVGAAGRGYLTVSGGAVLDARQLTSPAVDCFPCFNFVGNAAGSTGELTITGNGSFVNLWALTVGQAAVFTQANDGFDFGLPAGQTRGTIRVLDGGRLHSVANTISSGAQNNGPERTYGSVDVEGAGSTWRITSNLVNGIDASLQMATQANAVAELGVGNGGSLLFDAVPGRFSNLVVGVRGKADAYVYGNGANITFAAGANGLLQIGRNAGAIGSLSVLDGGLVTGIYYSSIGRDGGIGSLTVDGAGSIYRANADTTLAAAGGAFVASIDVGRNGGTGRLTVSNGGKVEIAATTSRSNSPGFSVGRDAASIGTVNVTGPGSVIEVTAASTVAGGGAAEARNPFVNVGRLGTGTLNITAGGKLLMRGDAVSTVADSRGTVLYIGGTGDTGSGGLGNVVVSGNGSEIALSGSDPFIGIGMGAGATGNLSIANQGLVRSTNINVGRSGGVGVVQMDNSRIELSGQQTGNTLAGAFMSLGLGGGSGVMTMSNGSVVSVANAAGNAATGFQLGGSLARPGGSGILQMSGGSRIEIAGPANLGLFQVGREGVGVVQMSDSDVDVGSTGLVHIGRAAGGSGVIRMSDGSTLTAGFVGVGRHQLADLTNADGGMGLLNVSSGSVITATNLVIGTKGVLSGDGIINANVINYGVISPGNSPGTLVINGNFSDAGGKLVLEIEADGLGGFNKDKIIFGPSSVVDFGGLNIEFQFLGATDPTAFLATGDFDVDAFIVRDDGAGNLAALPDSIYAGASFSAATEAGPLTGIVITPGGTVTAVPEPQTYALFGFGLAVLAWARRRSRS